ncbi:MFS transporter [Nocardioides zeae]|uniref:MFS family permease n=1 Tax=Nocardioides zeae TaxID=1457234 RepID=A0AAJ1U1K8_9ACTN|nr:MFS transporter [Nocardioides zeae]MDQ1105689.1 MFS family permease [Nocardioides zeae]
MFASLRVRNYRIYALGGLVSNVGTWLQATAQTWLVLELGGSGADIGLVLALQMAPTLLLSAWAGVLADRFAKRPLLAWLQVAMALPATVLGALAIAGDVSLDHVFVLATAFGVARALEAPARQSFVAEIVGPGHLNNAVALNSASFNAGRLVGPAAAGLTVATLGSGVSATGVVIVANGLSFGFPLLGLVMMDGGRLRPAPVTADRRRAIRHAVRYVRTRPDLLLIFACAFFLGCFGMNFQITSALMATEEFGRGAGDFGLLGSLLALGSLAGTLLAARRPAPRLRVLVAALAVFSTMQVITAAMPTFVTYAALLPLVGAALFTAATTANALVQITTAPSMRGRVASLYIMVFLGSVPLGAPLMGVVAELGGARLALTISGGVVGFGSLAASAWFARTRRRGVARGHGPAHG